ncbi:MAG: acetyl-CoA carboxylase carboxyltransferase subunit alpha [Chloroflexi bacterium]|nr:acetyl-CoA carboxylase carboxyltransferase subunit alpha [Chloroflexota bacterium]
MSPGRTPVETQTDAWRRVQLARHPQRPHTLDYVNLLFDDFVELHGDRAFADDAAIVGGPARFRDATVMVIGHQKGRDTQENVSRHFGMAKPEGYRKVKRLLHQAEKFGFPVLTLIDTPGADPGLGSEERGQASAIAECIFTLARLEVPVVVTIIGEGGSGGALALGVGDHVQMLENSIYSVASPEAAASILWRDSGKAPLAAEAMRITAPELMELGLVDGIVPEPAEGAHSDYRAAAEALGASLDAALAAIWSRVGRGPDLNVERLLEARHRKFRRVGWLEPTSD